MTELWASSGFPYWGLTSTFLEDQYPWQNMPVKAIVFLKLSPLLDSLANCIQHTRPTLSQFQSLKTSQSMFPKYKKVCRSTNIEALEL